MTLTQLAKDALLAAAGGYVGTLAMEQFSMKTYQLESEEARKQEDSVRPGPPYQIAADKISKAAGLELDEEQVEKAGMAMHYALGPSWLPVYILLRRRTSLHPLTAALATGASMSLIVDEGLTPALGFSAPNRAYPPVTHVRAVLAHLVFGVVAAAVVEGGWRLLERR
jgi:hypothetical protein